MKTVIMAGGKGTRIRSVSEELPKPMIQVGGKPVLWHVICKLKEYGLTEIIITVGYKAEVIQDYFGDGREFGVDISYFVEDKPLGNAGALFRLKEKMGDDFLLLNGDALFDIDLKRFIDFHKKQGGLITLFTHPNSHPYDSTIIVADNNGKVMKWLAKEDKKPRYYKNRVNAGIHIINPIVIKNNQPEKDCIDLDRDVIKPIVESGRVFCYDSSEYVKDMGTPERYERVCDDYKTGKIKARNLNRKQKAIFIDRDGTINRDVGFLRSIDDFELLPRTGEAIRRINESGFLAIVITNQPVIARGEVTEEGLQDIHNHMETLLGKEGAYLDDIYYCPHHPHSGYEGEIPELKIECDCRKPKPGLLLRAAEEHNIDLSASWMIGDDSKDAEAGKRAGCRTILLSEKPGLDQTEARSLYEAVDIIMKECKIHLQ